MALEPTERDHPGDRDSTFHAVHTLALRTWVQELPSGAEGLPASGLARAAAGGNELTKLGYRTHRALLERERSTLDLQRLGLAYARIPALARQLTRLSDRWQRHTGELTRRRMIGQFCELIDDTEPVLLRTVPVVPRFGGYLPRLHEAAGCLRAGRLEYAVEHRVGSVDAVWRELHEDYLQTLGRGHDIDDSCP